MVLNLAIHVGEGRDKPVTQNGAARVDGLPEIVAPVVTEATVERDGQITPLRNALARDVLSPRPSGEFSIDTVCLWR